MSRRIATLSIRTQRFCVTLCLVRSTDSVLQLHAKDVDEGVLAGVVVGVGVEAKPTAVSVLVLGLHQQSVVVYGARGPFLNGAGHLPFGNI